MSHLSDLANLMIGRVISTKLTHTATILVERVAMHPLYKKTFVRSKKYLVDDPIGVKDGDMVEIIKCQPISKNKHWVIIKVIGKNLAEIVEAEQKQAAEKIIAEVMPEEKEGDKQSLPSDEGRVQGIGSSEEIIEEKKTENKIKNRRKEKLVPKP